MINLNKRLHMIPFACFKNQLVVFGSLLRILQSGQLDRRELQLRESKDRYKSFGYFYSQIWAVRADSDSKTVL